jgi:hypothetical protein
VVITKDENVHHPFYVKSSRPEAQAGNKRGRALIFFAGPQFYPVLGRESREATFTVLEIRVPQSLNHQISSDETHIRA